MHALTCARCNPSRSAASGAGSAAGAADRVPHQLAGTAPLGGTLAAAAAAAAVGSASAVAGGLARAAASGSGSDTAMARESSHWTDGPGSEDDGDEV